MVDDGQTRPSFHATRDSATHNLPVLFTALAGCLETFSSDSAPTVSMTVSPSGTVKVGESVQFTATGQRPRRGSTFLYLEFLEMKTSQGK